MKQCWCCAVLHRVAMCFAVMCAAVLCWCGAVPCCAVQCCAVLCCLHEPHVCSVCYSSPPPHLNLGSSGSLQRAKLSSCKELTVGTGFILGFAHTTAYYSCHLWQSNALCCENKHSQDLLQYANMQTAVATAGNLH